jgi:hypothetical protein
MQTVQAVEKAKIREMWDGRGTEEMFKSSRLD